jgi:hypothetical protein
LCAGCSGCQVRVPNTTWRFADDLRRTPRGLASLLLPRVGSRQANLATRAFLRETAEVSRTLANAVAFVVAGLAIVVGGMLVSRRAETVPAPHPEQSTELAESPVEIAPIELGDEHLRIEMPATPVGVAPRPEKSNYIQTLRFPEIPLPTSEGMRKRAVPAWNPDLLAPFEHPILIEN